MKTPRRSLLLGDDTAMTHSLSAIKNYVLSPAYRHAVWVKLALSGSSALRFWSRRKLELRCGCRISGRVGQGLVLPHADGVIIGAGATIGERCTLYQQVTIGQTRRGYPTLGDDVVVYAGAKIIGRVFVGNRCVVGANAVVTDDCPDGAIVAGVPAKIIGWADGSKGAVCP